MKFPKEITTIFASLDVFNNLIVLGSPGCYTRFDYVDYLIAETVTPLVLIGLLILVFIMHAAYRRGNLGDVTGIYVTLGLLLIYVILPLVTTRIFGMFVCDNIDPSNTIPGTPMYLKRDYSISCSYPRYNFGFKWAVIMVFVYPVGALVVYFWILYYNRHDIQKVTGKENDDMNNDSNGNIASENEENQGDAYSSKAFTESKEMVVKESCMKYFGVNEISFLYAAYERKFWY